MSTSTPNAAGGEPETLPLLVSRQPVFDGRNRAVGYRLSYALVHNGAPVTPDGPGTVSVLDDVLSLIDHDEELLGAQAHVSLPRGLLLRGEVPNLQPGQALLRIRYEDLATPVLRPTIEAVADSGYDLELDALPGPDIPLGLLDPFAVVEIDFSRWSLPNAIEFLSRLRDHRKSQGGHGTPVALAAGLQTHDQRRTARVAGCQWFTGPFYSTPNTLAGAPIPIGDLTAVVELVRMQREDVSLEQLVELIEREVGLSLRLLRYINSAYFGFAGRVRSIAQAATMLGTRGLSRWALIVATLTGANPIPRELALMALTRARACELIAIEREGTLDSDELFTIGLLSACDAVFQTPIRKVVAELPLTATVEMALLTHTGREGEILAALLDYEQGRFASDTLKAAPASSAAAYREGLDWARRTVYGIV